MKGFKNKDNDFIPTEDGSKKIHSSQVNSSTETQPTMMEEKKLKVNSDGSKSFSEMSGEILRATHDGDDLSPPHLNLIQLAVNGDISEAGEVEFMKMFKSVSEGEYKPDYYHDIENMTQDHEGYILWKGKRVEHYSFDDYQDADFSAKELEANILDLESHNKEPNWTNISQNFEHLREIQPEWNREHFYVQGLDKDGKSGFEGSGYVDARDKKHAKEEFIRKNGNNFADIKVETYNEYVKRLEVARNR